MLISSMHFLLTSSVIPAVSVPLCQNHSYIKDIALDYIIITKLKGKLVCIPHFAAFSPSRNVNLIVILIEMP